MDNQIREARDQLLKDELANFEFTEQMKLKVLQEINSKDRKPKKKFMFFTSKLFPLIVSATLITVCFTGLYQLILGGESANRNANNPKDEIISGVNKESNQHHTDKENQTQNHEDTLIKNEPNIKAGLEQSHENNNKISDNNSSKTEELEQQKQDKNENTNNKVLKDESDEQQQIDEKETNSLVENDKSQSEENPTSTESNRPQEIIIDGVSYQPISGYTGRTRDVASKYGGLVYYNKEINTAAIVINDNAVLFESSTVLTSTSIQNINYLYDYFEVNYFFEDTTELINAIQGVVKKGNSTTIPINSTGQPSEYSIYIKNDRVYVEYILK